MKNWRWWIAIAMLAICGPFAWIVYDAKQRVIVQNKIASGIADGYNLETGVDQFKADWIPTAIRSRTRTPEPTVTDTKSWDNSMGRQDRSSATRVWRLRCS